MFAKPSVARLALPKPMYGIARDHTAPVAHLPQHIKVELLSHALYTALTKRVLFVATCAANIRHKTALPRLAKTSSYKGTHLFCCVLLDQSAAPQNIGTQLAPSNQPPHQHLWSLLFSTRPRLLLEPWTLCPAPHPGQLSAHLHPW